MVVVEGAALHFERTLDLDGTVHADEASEQDVRDMFEALVAVPSPPWWPESADRLRTGEPGSLVGTGSRRRADPVRRRRPEETR